MNIRKSVSIFLFIFLLLGALGGWLFFFINSQETTEDSHEDVRSFAEYITRLYLTVDQDLSFRKVQLSRIAPKMSSVMALAKGDVKQWVQQSRATRVDPYAIGKYEVEVKSWVVTTKKEVDENTNENKEVTITRHFMITYDIQGSPDQGYFISGLPRLKEIEIAEHQMKEVENPIDEALLMPLLTSAIPAIVENRLGEVQNYLTEGASVSPYTDGSYHFIKIIDVQIFEAGKQSYRVIANVQLQDQVSGLPMGVKMTFDIVEKEKKYYLQTLY